MEKCILTIDFGTQSVRTSIINKKGEILAIAKEKYSAPYVSLKRGWAEQDPDEYFNCLIKASKKMVSENKDLIKTVVAVAITCFRDSPVMCDENMKPVRPGFVWLDQRMAKAEKKLPLIHRFLFAAIGKKETIVLNRRRSPANWVQENEPEVWKKVKKYMNASTYLTYKLTNEYKDSIACYAGHYPTDFKHRSFYKKDNHMQGQIFGIKLKMLPKIVQPGDKIGTITKEASKLTLIPEGLPVIATGSDKACETVGLGAMKPTIAAISCGTASTVSVSNTKFIHPAPFLPAYPASVKGYFNAETQVYRGYWMIGWFAKEFADKETGEAKIEHTSTEKILSAGLKDVPPGSDGLVLQPYWGPGLSRPLARGSVIGFSDTHTKKHLYRAIIEGIDYDLREGLEIVEKNQHQKAKEIRISGGGSQCDEICQIAADVFNRPVSRVQTFETSSLGAAISAFVGIGEFKNVDEGIEAMVHLSKTFLPIEKNAEMYDYLFKHVYKKMYPALKNMYKDIKAKQ